MTTASLLILLVSQLLGNAPFAGATAVFAATKPKALPAHLTYQQFQQLSRQATAQHKPFQWYQPTTPSPMSKQEQASLNTPLQLPPSAEPPTMQPIKQALSAAFLAGAPGTAPLDLTSSDHHLEVQIPADAFDLSHASVSGTSQARSRSPRTTLAAPTPTATPAAAGGPTATPSATVTPSATATTSPRAPPASVGADLSRPRGPLTLAITEQHGQFVGQMNELAQYQWQILDARGHPVNGITLRHPLTIRYHYQPAQLTGLDLDPGSILLSWPNLAYQDRKAHHSITRDSVLMRNDPATDTLTVQSGVLDNGPFSVSGDPQNQSPPTPNEASVSGNTGQVSYSYPLQLAPAPDGFAPQLALSYSSGNTNQRQNVTSPAGDVGDGWTLALGAITATVFPNGQTWYSISGVDNISDRLVPDPSHIGWFFTQHLSYLRINNLLQPDGEPCFQVWDQSDTYYQFGCTNDSLQYRYDSNGLHLYQWDLNEIVAPNDGTAPFKNIVVNYFQDCGSSTGNCPSASNASGTDAIRDAAIEQIQYGIGSQAGVVSTASGTVDFSYWAPNAPSGSQWVIPYTDSFNGQSYACDGTPPENTHNMRCDDPQPDSDEPGSAPPPTVMSTLTLLSVTSYVGNDSGTGSFPAYQYQFTYTDTPLIECVDPLSQVGETCAGDHVLDSVTPFVYKHGTANQLQPLLLKYTSAEDGYYDTTQTVPGGNHYTIDTSWMYLSDEYDSNTGVGEHIDYGTAYNNSHGTPYNPNTQDNRYDPLYCWLNPPGSQYDCSGSFAYPDDRAWSTQVVIDRKSFGVDSSAMSQAETTYAYVLKKTGTNCPADSQNDTDCVGDNWWPYGDTDWQDYYHGQFQGFNFVNTVSPSGDLTQDNYFSTDGWGKPSSDPNDAFAGDLTEEDVYQGNSTSDPLLYDLTNNYGGLNGTNLPCDGAIGNPYDPCEPIIYSSVTTTYNGSTSSNPPTETTSYSYDDYNPPGSQPSSWNLSITGNYHHLLEETATGSNTNENSASNTITNLWTYTTTDSGYSPSGWYFYDVNKIAHSEIDDSATPMRKWDCQAFTYDEGSGSQTPEAGWPTTVSTYTSANCTPGNFTTPFTTSYTGYDVYGNAVASVDPLAQANQSFYGGSGISGKNGCSLNTAPAIMSTAWSKNRYTTCLTYDPTYNALPTTTTNAFSQTASTSYDAQMGELPKAVTDPNSQATSYTYSYDSSGNRTVQVSEPGETSPLGYTTESATKSGCASSIPTSAITPCFEIDSNSSLYPTAVTETFYDGLGRQVETRAPGPTSGDDTIQFTVYNDSAHTSFTSVPFEVTAGSGWLDPATAKDKNGDTPAGSMTYADALGRVIAGDDPLFNPPSVPGIWCSSINANATACTVYKLDSPAGSSTLYETEKDIDPNNHVMEAFTDAMGRTADIQNYSGTNGNGLAANQQISYQYDALGEPTQITTIDLAPQNGQSVSSVTTTMSYDDLGRLIQLVDPDRGTHAYTYDPNGNVLNDTSGSRTIGYNDDLLGRIGCVQSGTAVSDADGSCTSGTNVQVQNTYDTTQIGTQGTNDFPIGRLTKSQSYTYYPEGGSTQSTEKYQYDQRGRVTTEQLKLTLPTSWNLTLPTYQLTELYTDADQPETTQTSTINGQGQNTPQYTESEVYDQTLGVLTGLSSTNNVTTPNLATVGYTINSLLGAINVNSSAGVGSSLATESFSYDGDLRPTEEAATWQSGSGQSGTFFDNVQGYDAASNVDTVTTTISQPNGQSGSDSETQNFCYDEQNRLVWAGNSGTQPSPGNGTCGSGTLANSFPGASYATSFSYTNLGQLWQGPLNGVGSSEQYLYCNSQPHQVSDIVPAGQGYTCSNLPSSIPYAVLYDQWGNVTSRSYNTQTAALSYNKLDEMVEWQVPNTNQAWYAYDANGERTLERSTTGSTTTETVYAFGLEEYSYDSSGNQTSSTHYYSLAGHLIGEAQTSGTSTTTNFFMTDALGSVLAVISNTQNSATLLSNQVFAPYGKPLSHNGNSLSQYTNKGFTGQYNDPTSGLDYYVSRYYDPVSGVFLSADKTLGDATGMNPYSYVGNNPETNNDPSGQAYIPPGGGGGGGSGGSGGTGGTGGGTGSGGGGAGYGGGGMGDPGSGGHEGGGCAWWNPSCDVQQIWHTIVNGAQTVEHDVETDVSDGMHFLQQQEQKIIEESWKLVVKIIVAIVAAAIAFGFFLYGALRNGPTDEQRAGRIQKKAHDAWQNQTPKRRNQSDYGGAYLVISGPNKKNQDYLSDPFIASGDPHVELQAIEWAKDMIAEYLKKYGSITSVNLLIYTYKYPCGTCASNLQDGTWQRQLQQAAGGNANVQIAVYYGLPVKQWLPSP